MLQQALGFLSFINDRNIWIKAMVAFECSSCDPILKVRGEITMKRAVLLEAKDHGPDVTLHPETWRKYKETMVTDAPIVIG